MKIKSALYKSIANDYLTFGYNVPTLPLLPLLSSACYRKSLHYELIECMIELHNVYES